MLVLHLKIQNRREFLKTTSSACFSGCLLLAGNGLTSCLKSYKKKEILPANGDFSMVAYCCLKCNGCDAYLATKNNDQKLREETAKK
jgi:hypothetical protein